jgi:glycosyltransferase involved in cell wall biosynthesis
MGQIAIITATYNSARELPVLIDSLRQQTCHEFEWIVVDGASSDDTLAILKTADIANKKIVSEPDRGIYDALNKGIRLSSSDYYLIVGSDDYLTPEAIEQYAAALRGEAPDLITAPIMAGEIKVSPAETLGRFRSGPASVSAHSVGTVIRKQLHEIHGYYSLSFTIAADTHFLRKVVRSPTVRIRVLPTIAGRFGMKGHSSKDRLATLTDSFRANVAAGENLFLQWFLFSLRLIKNLPRILKDRAKS